MKILSVPCEQWLLHLLNFIEKLLFLHIWASTVSDSSQIQLLLSQKMIHQICRFLGLSLKSSILRMKDSLRELTYFFSWHRLVVDVMNLGFVSRDSSVYFVHYKGTRIIKKETNRCSGLVHSHGWWHDERHQTEVQLSFE